MSPVYHNSKICQTEVVPGMLIFTRVALLCDQILQLRYLTPIS